MKEFGYHGTCSKYRYSIETHGLDPHKCKYRDDHWLGQGVYFFDDYDKALWWASTISSQNGNCGSVIFKSVIEASDDVVLNLDDNSQLDKFMTEIINTTKEIEKECSGKMPIFEDKNFRAVFLIIISKKMEYRLLLELFKKTLQVIQQKEVLMKKKSKRK